MKFVCHMSDNQNCESELADSQVIESRASEDSNGDSDGFLEPSLCIDRRVLENFTCTDTPSNGHEYLFTVMNEAKKCPRTVVAKLNRSRINQNIYSPANSLVKISDEFLPSEDWKQRQIDDFNSIRQTLARCSFFGPSVTSQVELETKEEYWNFIYNEKGEAVKEPLLSNLSSLDQIKIVSLVEHHSEWLENRKLELNDETLRWIYSLLCLLEIPLDPDTCGSLRTISRLAWSKRSGIKSKEGAEGKLLESLNLIICLIGMFFGQLDLAD